MLHISIKAEPLFYIYGFAVTNSYLATLIVVILFFILALYYKKQTTSLHKSKLFYLLHYMFVSSYKFFGSIMEEKIGIFYPILASFLFFILLSNWFGLIPGVGSILVKKEIPLLRGADADLNTTLALAIISFILIQYFGIKELGIKSYLKKFLNLANPIAFFTGILEIISEFSKIISFSFRLFGNIFAGEVLLTIMAFLIPILGSFPFLLLEIFVGFIQALVFAALTAIFIRVAMVKSH